MSLLIPTGDVALITQAMDDLWETFPDSVTIVKEPVLTMQNISGAVYMPGFGISANTSNFIPIPESGTFSCLTVERHGSKLANIATDQQNSEQDIYLKVKEAAKTYIRDGRNNLHAVYRNRKYNIASDEQIADMLSNTYYIFTLKLIQ